MPFILARKIEMSQIFDNEGNAVPITLLAAGPCEITQVKNKEKDGYSALQIGFEKRAPEKVNKSLANKSFRYLREFDIPEKNDYKLGDKIDVASFKEGDKVRVSGISKGKGFQGAVKRWGFHGRNATHGVKHEHRTLGSVGPTEPARVFPGKKMPGRMGSDRIVVKNLKIVKVDLEKNLLAIEGAVPGRRGTLLEIKS